MKNAILVCSEKTEFTEDYSEILTLGTLIQLELESKGIFSKNIFDIKIQDYNYEVRKNIETQLEKQSKEKKSSIWLNLAYQHILYRFIYFYQYKLRIESFIKKNQISHFCLSSDSDDILKFAFIGACKKNSISYNILEGPMDRSSSLLPLSATYDLPKKVFFIEKIISYLLAFYYRICKIKFFYESYNNSFMTDGFKISFRRSISFFGLALPNFNSLDNSNGFINTNQKIKKSSKIKLAENIWHNYDEIDREVIKSSIEDFFDRYKPSSLQNVFNTLRSFFKISKTKKIILSSDNNPAARFLIYTAKKAGLKVDFLPHGLMYDFQYLKTGREFSSDKILAFNRELHKRLRKLKIKSKVYSKTMVSNFPNNTKKKELPKNLHDLKVLILLNDWIGLSFKNRPDCFENDLLETIKALKKIHISSISVKYHNSTLLGKQIKRNFIERLIIKNSIDIDIINPNINPKSIFTKFDLIILGCTSGILDLLDSPTPFIIFRGFIEDVSIFNQAILPIANNHSELINEIKKMDVKKLSLSCKHLLESINN